MKVLYINQKSTWGEEMRFSLRSLEKYFHADYQVVICGYVPDYIDPAKIEHIPYDVQPEVLTKKLLHAIKAPGMSDDFLYMCDDFLFLKDATPEDCGQLVLEDMNAGSRDGSLNNWQKMLWKTFDYARAFGGHGWNAETHTPKMLDRQKLLAVMDKYRPAWEHATKGVEGIAYETAYYNEYPPEMHSYAHAHRFHLLYPEHEWRVIEALAYGRKFMFYNEEATKVDGMINFLNQKFPEKSKYEL